MLKKLHNIVEKLRPTFSEGGKLSALHSLFDGLRLSSSPQTPPLSA